MVKTIRLGFALLGLTMAANWLILDASSVQAAGCTTPTTDRGSVTSTISIPQAGTYRIWSRIMSGATSTDNSYLLEVDGTNCYTVGDSTSIPASTWTWVDYQNGTTTSKINISLTAGSHTLKMIGREDGVQLDRILATTDTTCTPTGTGDSCSGSITPPPPTGDTNPPTVSLTPLTSGATISSGIAVGANASDDVGVSKVDFYLDGTLYRTETSAPYCMAGDDGTCFNWDSTTVSNGSHTIQAKAYDDAGNVGTKSVTFTVNNTTSSKLGDINKDNSVNIFDLSILLTNYNTATASCDLNSDNTVNIFDLSILLSHYGT